MEESEDSGPDGIEDSGNFPDFSKINGADCRAIAMAGKKWEISQEIKISTIQYKYRLHSLWCDM